MIISGFRKGVRAKMIMGIMTNGYNQQEAEALADENLDTCEAVAQAAWDAAIDDLVTDCGWPRKNALMTTASVGMGAACKWAKANVA